MPRQKKLSAAKVQELEDREDLRKLVRSFGRAMCLTMVAANLEPGDEFEDEAVAGMDEGWTHFADYLFDFARRP